MDTVLPSDITFWNELGTAFCRYAAGMLMQTAVLVVLLLILDLAIRRRVRAVFRYWVWMLVLIKLVLPPSVSLPTGIGYWCADYWPQVSVATTPVERHMVNTAIEIAELSTPSASSVRGGSLRVQSPLPQEPPSFSTLADHSSVSAVVRSSTSIPAPVGQGAMTLKWPLGLAIAWLAGVLLLGGAVLYRVRAVYQLVGRSVLPDAQLTKLFEACCRQANIRTKVDLRLSEALGSPAVCGILRPTVLIPPSLVASLNESQLHTVLIHELMHVARGDLVAHALQTVLQVLHFYNPFVWMGNAVIRRVREQAVDEAVLVALGRNPADYSDTLLDVAEKVFHRPAMSLGLLGVIESRSALAERIRHILSRPAPRSARLGFSGIAAVLMLAAIAVPMAGASAKKPPAPAAVAGVLSGLVAKPSPVAAPASRPISAEPNFVARGVVSGRITDEKGQPVTDAKIQLDNGQEYYKAGNRSRAS